MNNDIHMFRVWDKLEKRYVRQLLLGVDGLLYEIIDGKAVSVDQSRYEREQCTGLRDRNGKLIYKGDILENTPAGWMFRVEWNGAAWFAESNEPPLLECLNIMPLGICKVVGNIHEVKYE